MMATLLENEEDSSDSDEDVLDEDLEALRQACILTGTTPGNVRDFQGSKSTSPSTYAAVEAIKPIGGGSLVASDSDSDEDFQLVRNIQDRFSLTADSCEPLSLKPLSAIHPFLDREELEDDDFETLRAVQRRFEAYNTGSLENGKEDFLQNQEHINVSGKASKNETLNYSIVNERHACEENKDLGEGGDAPQLSGDCKEIQLFDSRDQHQSDACKFSMLPLRNSSFPKSAQVFIDAIKKNRSFQKFVRAKMTQIEARLEENKKLRERIKILKDFQAACKKVTGRALSQRKDPRFQLISARDSKVNAKKASATHFGPVENYHVANYRVALTNFPIVLHRNKWTEAEKENLVKGIRQQFQKLVLQISEDLFSGSEGTSGNASSFDDILASVRDFEITPEQIREFLPKVNWDELASLYVMGRSGAECEARWLNFEDPLINREKWTPKEDKLLLYIVQEKGITNWFDIAVSLGTNRTPYQCLARFQRSLNACILKKEWTKEEDAQLRTAVEAFGESNWQSLASTLEGRTGPQCSNRWKKSLHPGRQKVGRWALDEDKRLTVAAMIFGQKNWNKIAKFVSGRTQVQCRERWVNSLDPSVNRSKWTEEEDSKLKAAAAENGYCWSKVASCLPSRTDNQCWRRWKVLVPDEFIRLQQARRIQKAALIGNFVDRESERPALGPNDFIPLSMICAVPESENVNQPRQCKRKLSVSKKITSKRLRKEAQICSEEVPGTINDNEVEIFDGHDATPNKKMTNCNSQLMTGGCEVVDSVEKKRFLKCQSESSRSLEPDGERTSLLVFPSESLESGTTDGGIIRTCDGRNATSNKKMVSRKQHARKRLHVKSGQEQCGMGSFGMSLLSGTIDGTELINDPSVHQDSTSLMVTSGEEPGILHVDNASGEKTPKLRTRRKACISSDERCNGLAKPLQSMELRNTGCKGGWNLVFDTITSSKGDGFLKQFRKRKRRPELAKECQEIQIVHGRRDGPKISKYRAETSSKQLLQTPDDDDIKISALLNNKLKNRKSQVARSACQSCSPTMESCEKLDGLDAVDCRAIDPCQPVSTDQSCDCETDDITLACFLRNSHKKNDMDKIIAPLEHGNTGQEGNHAADVDTLACFLRSTSKKRRLKKKKLELPAD
ncbi:uncharacterized protein LOC120017044 isoform X2 [Tripterygium wilfordii]|uniref:uncharacterized protein LOC120017044 isoform X2 n=1 Tax=Tripterygium wilfordii TaxID=458696 RepID=UPI0018F7F834|nr:uncharacterized protein LOC120017044 isoform X2 [Tripterygium wilfordii]